jgi:beta-phosphoglucomutase-like phosphatase (HAD superfamily)
MKKQTPPEIILFDWHATLVDTSEALYHALEDVLPQLEALGLRDRKTGKLQSCLDPGRAARRRRKTARGRGVLPWVLPQPQ